MEKIAMVEYHSKDWDLLVTLGYITMYILSDNITAVMLWSPKYLN